VDKLSRADRAILVGLVTLLLVLLGLAVANQSGAAHPAGPVAATTPSSNSHPSDTGVPSTGGPSDPATTRAEPTTVSTPPSTAPLAGPVSAVGDSLMIDIEPFLQADLSGVSVDGMVSRQFETGVGVVQAERAAGTLGRVLVVELGTNGTVTAAEFDAMMQAASGVARVVFVNVFVPRSWEAGDNAVLAEGVARYPGVAVLADWYTLASGHPEWFAADQVHLQPAGASAMAGLIAAIA
jgi:hypothetical protein